MQLVILWKVSTNGTYHLPGNFLVAPLICCKLHLCVVGPGIFNNGVFIEQILISIYHS